MTGIPGQDVNGQCGGEKVFNGVDGYMNNRQKMKEKEDEKEKEKKDKEKFKDKKKKDKESNKEGEELTDNGGVFDFLKSVLHLNPRARHCLEDVQKFALFQPFLPSTSTSTSTSISASTLYKAFLTPQASPFSFSF